MQLKNVRKITFAQNLAQLLQMKGLRAADLARELGLSHVAIGNYLKGLSLPDGSILFDLARFFAVSMEDLFSPAPKASSNNWGGMVEDKPSEQLREASKASHPKNWGGPYFGTSDAAPLISWASAGMGRAYIDQGHDVPGIKTNCRDPNCYALAVENDSMEPIYHPGDIMICAPNLEARPLDLVMVRTTDEEVLFKRYLGEKKGLLRFESFNPNYPVKEFKRSEIDKIHVVHSVIRFLKDKVFR